MVKVVGYFKCLVLKFDVYFECYWELLEVYKYKG